ncbi:MAG: thiamine monophosphate synthase [Myxococcota bacterium]|jgi:thiamine monophosphate synthase
MMPTLIAITPGDGRQLSPWIVALGAAGLPAILIREPGISPGLLADLAACARRHIPTVYVHDRCIGARHLATDGVHLSSTADLALAPRPFGVSCHTADAVDRALAAGAAWAFWSPVWPPTSKPDDTRQTIGVTRFVSHAAGLPVYALGGVTPARHRALRAAGAHGTAVLGDLFGQPSPRDAARRLERYSTAKMNTSGS